MYTQCPDCATVFRVTAEALRAAQGDVRCGVCATSFNALENLSEAAFRPEAEAEAPQPDDSMTVEELPGGENIELSAPVELAAVPDPEPEPEPDAEPDIELEPESEPVAPAAAAAPAEDEARAMEFHGDAADLDKLFVVEEPAVARFDPVELEAGPAEPEGGGSSASSGWM